MLVKPGEHAHLAELLTFMVMGEQLAHDCAKAQCALAPEWGMKTFLSGQSRQEGYHALVFQGAIRWLMPRSNPPSVVSQHMTQYRRLIESALTRKNFAETLIAEQIILEGLGEAILTKIEAGLVKRGAPFQRLRRILIHQEEAHRQFGLRILSKMVKQGEESYDSLLQYAHTYLPLAKMLLFSTQEMFAAIQEDPQEFWDEFQHHLPPWLPLHSEPITQSLNISVAQA